MFGVVGELSWATGAAAAAVDDVCLHNCHFSTAVLAGLAALATAIVTRQRERRDTWERETTFNEVGLIRTAAEKDWQCLSRLCAYSSANS